MKTPESDLHIAALAAAALPHVDFNGTIAPRYRDDDIAMCGLVDTDDKTYLAISALNETASLALTSNDELCRLINRLYKDGDISFDAPVIRGTSRMRKGGRCVVYNGFKGELLATIFPDELWPHPDWVESLADTVAQLHNISLPKLAHAKLPTYSTDQIRKRLLTSLDEATATGKIPSILAGRWENMIEDVSLWHFTPTLIHTNISPGSVFGEDGTVTALIDWGDAYIGDPAEDIATIVSGVDAQVRDQFFTIYRRVRRLTVDSGLEARTDLMTEFALVRWLLFGIRRGDDAIVADAKQMLDELAEAIENEDAANTIADDVADADAGDATVDAAEADIETTSLDSGADVSEDEALNQADIPTRQAETLTEALDMLEGRERPTSEENISTEALDMRR